MYDRNIGMRTMLATDSFDRDATEIEESVNEIAGHLNAQHARLVDHVATLLGPSSRSSRRRRSPSGRRAGPTVRCRASAPR